MARDDQLGGDATQPGALSTGRASDAGERGRSYREVAIGDRLGDYAIERRLGAGGMGEVFAARPLAGGERVALKILAEAGSTALYRFKREFRALADVTHPNLIALHELVVPEAGVPFFTMELVDGVPFTDYVRGRTPAGQLPNLVRLGRALSQLVVGLHHLHLAQCLHRDVKPSNVLVSRTGRVVILDFGLVSELVGMDVGLTHDGSPLGTPAYMAPEQAIAGKTSPASDYYAVGVMLFECLTGELPFRGSAIEVMVAKQGGEIPDPRALVPDVPDELRSLCIRLLARDPEMRPTGPALVAAFEQLDLDPAGGSSSGGSSSSSLVAVESSGSASLAASMNSMSLTGASMGSMAMVGSGSPVGFVGRRAELDQLSAGLRDVEEIGTAVTVHVHGASGFGKSALLRRFLSRVRRKHDALVLNGRCFERESVPYKGLDAIIDVLSLSLRRMSAVDLVALQPRHLGALTRIFPAFVGIWEGAGSGPAGEGAEQRRLGLAALRELLERVSARQPLVVCIDDFQWADVDSVRLLNALLRPPDPPAVLVMLGFRDDLEPSAAMTELTDPSALVGRDVRELPVAALAEQDALDLTMKLMGDAADPSLARIYVERAAANPFYLGQMVLGAAVDGVGELSLDEIVARRIVDLDAERRELLAFAAVAGGPLSLEILGDLLASDRVAALADELSALGLLLRTRSGTTTDSSRERGGRPVEIAQAQIREVILGELELPELRTLHLRLAAALERRGADLETLAAHFARGGEAEKAADYTERAAVMAAEALAFARAAELYRQTLELLPATAPSAKRRELRLALAEQLINLGYGASASDILLELAVTSKPEEAARLRQRAAEQLLRAGRVDEGLDLSQTLFHALGEPMPRGFWGAVWLIMRERGRLWLRERLGRQQRLRPEAEIPRELLTRVDALSNVATGLSLQDVILTQALQARALVLAREAGEARRLGLVLSHEFVTQAALGNTEKARSMMVECRELALKVDDRELDRAIDLSEAMIDWFASRMTQARERLLGLQRRLENSPGADWIRAYAAIRYAETCMMGGHVAELRREMPNWISAAREHGNLHELASLLGIQATASLYFDDLEGARRSIDAAREVWDSSRYTVPDLTVDLSAVNVLIYAGEYDRAEAQVEEAAANVRASGMGRIGKIADLMDQARARVWARAAVRRPGDVGLRRKVEQAGARIRRFDDPLYRGEALVNQAALLSLAGDPEATRRCWRVAASHLEEQQMASQLAAVHLRLAGASRGREAADYEARAEAYLRAQGISNRGRFVDWLAPMAD